MIGFKSFFLRNAGSFDDVTDDWVSFRDKQSRNNKQIQGDEKFLRQEWGIKNLV